MKLWRIGVLVMLLLVGTIGPVSAQGKKPGGPGAGELCPVQGGAQIVLDPGHGGSDPGAQAFGLVEKELNLDIAQKTMALLVGYSVALTRYDNATYLENSQRGAIANACGASVFVEIHLNASSDPAINYSQAFWGKKRKDLDFSSHMSAYLSTLTGDARVGQFANGGLLHAEMESTLIEAVFLTNPDEAARLQEEARRWEIAQAIADGIVTWPGL